MVQGSLLYKPGFRNTTEAKIDINYQTKWVKKNLDC